MSSCRAALNASTCAPAVSTDFWPRFAAAPVANSRQVSLVEVSPSTVMQLKVVAACRASEVLQRRLGNRRRR